MNLLESMQKRHAVRDYNDEPLTAEQVNTLGGHCRRQRQARTRYSTHP